MHNARMGPRKEIGRNYSGPYLLRIIIPSPEYLTKETKNHSPRNINANRYTEFRSSFFNLRYVGIYAQSYFPRLNMVSRYRIRQAHVPDYHLVGKLAARA